MNKSQIRFSRTLTATWKVLHDPVLTNIYVRKWKRQRDIRLTIYGFVFREMYKAAWRYKERQAMCYSGREMVATQIAYIKRYVTNVYRRIMLVSFQSPVVGAIGKLEHDGKFYIRRMYGKYILQRCPNRKGHVPTPEEKANQERFIRDWRKSKTWNHIPNPNEPAQRAWVWTLSVDGWRPTESSCVPTMYNRKQSTCPP